LTEQKEEIDINVLTLWRTVLNTFIKTVTKLTL